MTDEQLAALEQKLTDTINGHLGLHVIYRMHSKVESDGSTEKSNLEAREALAALVAEVRRLRGENERLAARQRPDVDPEKEMMRERLHGAAAGLPVCLCGFDGKTVSVGCPVHRADALPSRRP